MAALIYQAACVVVFLALISGGVGDFYLWIKNLETISLWLRDNPSWFFIPATLMQLFIVGMFFHLYVLPEGFGGLPK